MCWEFCGLGGTPIQFELPSPGRTWEERREITEQVLAALRERGLADHTGLRSELIDTLKGLAQFTWCVDCRLRMDSVTTGLGAATQHQGVLAVREGDQIRMARLPEYQVIAETVSLAGQVPAGPGDSITVRAGALDAAIGAARGDSQHLAEVLVARGASAVEARALAQLWEQGGWCGQFGVTFSTESGPVRASRVVGFFDTPAGRYVQLRRLGFAGTTVTIAPASHRKLVAAVEELLVEEGQD